MLLGIWVIAFGLRCFYLWQIQGAPFIGLRIGDGAAYHAWARAIADGDWLGQGVFYQAPLYPYFLAFIYRILDDSVTTVRIVQAFLGACSCTLLAAAGIRLFGRRGAIAGLALAIYPPAIFLDGLIEKSPLVTFLTTALLALLCTVSDSLTVAARFRRWAGAGAILGLLALTRENTLVLVVPILLWIAIGPFRRLAPALAFVGGCALILVPVGLRNLVVGGEFHLTTSQFGPNFYIGNHAGANGTYEALVTGHGSARDEREDATRLAEQAAGRKLGPGEVSRNWTARSLEYIRSQPFDWLKLMARKLALTFNAAEVSDSESQDVYAEWSWLLRLARPLNFGLLLGLAVLGVVVTSRSWRHVWLLYALAATYAFSIALFYVFARYRFPLVPVLLLLAAGGIGEVRDRFRLRQFRSLAPGAVAAVLAVAFSHLPLDDASTARATHYLNIASVLPQDDQAMGFFQRALDTAPGFPAAHLGIGTLLARVGRTERAIVHYRAALKTWPAYAEARYNLGLALAATGRAQEAAEQYTEALRMRPDDADTHIALAKTLIVLKQPDMAREHYQQGLAARPNDVTALVGLGVALTQMGRPAEAIEKYRRALDLDPRDFAAHNSLGFTLANQGRIAEAVPYFERALALKPGDENARRNLEQARQILAQKGNGGRR